MVTSDAALAQVWAWLAEIEDPEIPVLSILDLGIVRDVAMTSDEGALGVRVAITPTYSGCPAIAEIERAVLAVLHARGFERVVLERRLFPSWSTDWLTQGGREKLRAYGISPPGPRAPDPLGAIDLIGLSESAACPRCGSTSVELVSRFGSTPCKAHYRCTACREPFDHFKTH